jgi:hypothetical protein
MQRLRQGLLVSGLAGRQLPETQPGHPAVAALDQVVQGLATQAVGWRPITASDSSAVRRKSCSLSSTAAATAAGAPGASPGAGGW